MPLELLPFPISSQFVPKFGTWHGRVLPKGPGSKKLVAMCYAALQTQAMKSQLGPYQFHVQVRTQTDLLERVVYPLQVMLFGRRATKTGEKELVDGQFGLVPDWVDDERGGPKYGRHCYNARSESVFDKPSFRKAIMQRRAVIPVAAFLEVADVGPTSGKHFSVAREDKAPIFLAGLWEHNARYNLESCSIITSEPIDLVKDSHSRSPVLLAPQDLDRWLDPSLSGEEISQEFLKVGSSAGLVIQDSPNRKPKG